MIDRPVVLLTFANQQDDYLKNLKEESRRINDLLSPHHDKNAIEVYREESATIDTIGKALQRFSKRIIIFHYAGHADGDRLYLEDAAGNAAGIAGQLGLLPNLQLVFLNGCSTLAQVRRLLDLGVKAIIATAVPIDDHKAVEFAEKFYGALAQNNNISRSFKFAVEGLKTRYGGTFDATIVPKNGIANFSDTQQMPWALFVNDNGNDVLSWEMPTTFTTQVTRPPDTDPNFEVNMYMEDVFWAILDENPKLKPLVQSLNGDEVDRREAIALIIETMPWPVGVQMRLLASSGAVSADRVQQIVSTYIAAIQFLFYVSMSQLWDERRSRYFPIYGYLVDVLQLDARRQLFFDYFKAFIDSVKSLKENQIEPFVKEFSDVETEFATTGSPLNNAYLYLESLRSKVNNPQNAADIEANKAQYCADGEYFLCTLLVYTAFMVKYDLITIRDIQVVNPKHLNTRFNHYIGRLNAKVADIAVSRVPKPRPFDAYAHNASVVLTTDSQSLTRFLNLSPFVIDKNAFGTTITDTATEQQLYMYAHREGDEYRYYATQHSIYKIQERPSDQLLTNQGGEEGEGEGGRRRITRIRSNAPNPQTNEETPLSPYHSLKEQFKLLEKDLLS